MARSEIDMSCGAVAGWYQRSCVVVGVVLVVQAPPGVGVGLRPPRWRVLPRLLAAKWRQVEHVVVKEQMLHASVCGVVGLVDRVAVPQEDAQPVLLAAVGGGAEVAVEL